jgi:hypothetical protein
MSIFDYANPKISKVLPFVLTSGAVVQQGDLLCGDPATGKLVVATAATDTMIPVGFATRDATGDGTTPIEVALFEPIYSYSFANDTVAPVTIPFTECFIKDAFTVQATGTAKCMLGVVIAADTARVQVRVTPTLTNPAPPALEE